MAILHQIPGLNELIESKWFRPALQGVGAVVVLGLGYFAFSAYQRSVQEKAHQSFVEALTYFDATISDEPTDGEKTFKTEEEKWQKVATVFKDGYSRNSSAGIAPLFAAYEAQALIELGDKVDAEKLLSECVPHIPNDALRSFFQVKLALLRLDSDSPAVQAQGEKLLQEVDVVQRVVGLGRAAREASKLRVRQPLAVILVRVPDEAAMRAVESHRVQILDELNVAVGFNLVKVEQVMELLDIKPPNVELLITGRMAPPELIERADLVTEMTEVKHPFSQGVLARRGIDN